MSKSQYIDKREAAKSYRPTSGSMSPGLRRAREPYRVKNALLGLTLGAFAVGVWAYSISAVKQDVFDDVDAEAEALGSTVTSSSSETGLVPAGTEKVVEAPVKTSMEIKASQPPVVVKEEAPTVPKVVKALAGSPRGVLPRFVDYQLPWLLDPETKTLVWGAPSVDNIGKLQRRS
ncbi:unnamed protein product [Cyclocybe aegerita]|uniref:Cytochrome c oxidase assembly factor 3 n=1 Tax=Cyclocybe aegerita TaxID=1973307 RepID=A0A8S0XJH3_CYCAE|nr:unnamed protein product [Cyclocybe aegerita]